MSAKLSISALLLFLLSACVEEVDLELPPGPDRIVILSNFTIGTELRVSVARTRSATSVSDEPFQYFADADVRLFSGLAELAVLELVIPADQTEAPYYRTSDFMPEVGIRYTIKVNVPGFPEATASSTIPLPVAIESVNFSSDINAEPDPEEAELNFRVGVSIQDPADEANYYHLRFSQEFFRYRIEGNDTIINPATLQQPLLRVRAINDELMFLAYAEDQGVLIRDDMINGLLSTYSFEGSIEFDSELYLPGKFIVELRSVSEGYYQFHASLARQGQAEGPFTTGVDLTNNVNNGLGNFSGFSSTTSGQIVNR